MIAKLRGVVDRLDDGSLVLDVNGVGYLVFGSKRTLDRLGAVGSSVSLHIEPHVREDHIHLFGFADASERDCFQLLQTVQGVGAKAALAILSALSPEDVLNAIAAQDKAMLTRADGVGPKLGQRIVNELKDKTASILLSGLSSALPVAAAVAPIGAAEGPLADAVSALVNLGYGRSEAFAAVGAAARKDDGANVQALITAGLKELSS